jgi:hypothetical protein
LPRIGIAKIRNLKTEKRSEQQVKLYQSFCEADGCQHIASEYAIKKLDILVRRFQIQKILEVGLGIGSISGIILAINKNGIELDYTGTEANEFCLNALPENLKENYINLKIYSKLSEIPSNSRFNLIIIDGKDHNLEIVKDLISTNGIIAIEGDRMPQQNSLKEFFPQHKIVHCISIEKNKIYSPFPSEHWQGGLKIIFIKPTGSQKFWWMWEKISTKFKYFLVR